MIILFGISLVIFLNFVYRAIRLFRGLIRQGYAEDTIHHFKCSHCEETYPLTGPEAKKHRWAPRKEVKTPRRQEISYKFRCPHCDKRVAQIQVFDTNITKGLGAVRIQINDKQTPLVMEFLIKGILPCIIYSMLFSLIN